MGSQCFGGNNRGGVFVLLTAGAKHEQPFLDIAHDSSSHFARQPGFNYLS